VKRECAAWGCTYRYFRPKIEKPLASAVAPGGKSIKLFSVAVFRPRQDGFAYKTKQDFWARVASL
jgi:hypothetical protein